MKFGSIDEYLSGYEKALKDKMQALRETILSAAPKAKEIISWNMPTFWQGENLVHFAAAKNHIGLYPSPEAIEQFKAEFDKLGLKYSKGAVQFPHDKELPLKLVENIVKHRVDTIKKL